MARRKKPEPVELTAPVEVPLLLWQRARDILAMQGTDVETFVRLQLAVLCRSRSPMRLRDEMTFGKYRGAVVEDVVRTDPHYVSYIFGLEGVVGKFATEVLALVEEIAGKQIGD